LLAIFSAVCFEPPGSRTCIQLALFPNEMCRLFCESNGVLVVLTEDVHEREFENLPLLGS
jgi:hypothetical protein